MKKRKVLCTAPFNRFPTVVEHFHSTFDGEILEYLPHKAVVQAIGDYEGFIPNARIAVDAVVLDRARRLKAIYQPSIGYDHIDTDYCERDGIAFDGLGMDVEFKQTLWSTAEHTVSLILALLKQSARTVYDVKISGAWDNRQYYIRDLRNLEVGIIGLGNIGSKVGHICNAFGAHISAFDPYVSSSQVPEYVSRRSLDEIMSLSDVVTIHTPLNQSTKGMISGAELGLMKSDALLVNVARGGIVDEACLIESLKNVSIGGYAADVLDGESPFGVSKHELVVLSKERDDILITPHIGGSSFPYMESIFIHSIDKLAYMMEC